MRLCCLTLRSLLLGVLLRKVPADHAATDRTNDSVVSLRLVAQGLAVTLLPDLVAAGAHPGVVVRTIAEGPVHRTIFTATRTADAERPSVRALLTAVRTAATGVGW